MRILGFILFFVLLLLLGSIGVKAQVQATGSVTQLVYQRGGYGADSVFGMPVRDTFCNNFPAFRCRGRMTIQPATYQVYINDGTYWRPVGEAIDTTSLSNRINERVKYTDTAAMLANYQTGISLRVRYSDTASMLLPYLRKFDTTAMLAPYLRSNVAASTYWALGGNATGATQSLGTTSVQPFNFITSNSIRGGINAVGTWTIGNSSVANEYIAIFDNSGNGQVRVVGGLGAALPNNEAGIIMDGSGGLSTYSVISGVGNNMNIGAEIITMAHRTTATISPVMLAGGTTSTAMGDIMRLSLRSAWNGFAFAPTTGTTSVVTWATNGANTNYAPSSGTHRFIGYRFAPTIAATATYSGNLTFLDFDPTVTSVGNGTVIGLRMTHNIGWGIRSEGTALNHFNGRALFGTLTDNTVDQVQCLGSLRANIFKSSNMNAGDLSTDSIVVYNSATDEFRRGAPLSSAITSVLYETYGSGSVQTTNATPATIATIAVPTNNTTLSITFEVTGKTATTGRVANLKRAYVTNNGGTLTLIGGSVVTPTPTQRDAPLTTADFTVTTSGTNALIQVTGEAATTINWNCTYKYNTN